MPSYSTSYSFTTKSTETAAFTVISFSGRESISECYEFEIIAACPSSTDLDKVMASQATLNISTETISTPYHGVVLSIDQLMQVHDYMIVKAHLVPRFSLLKYASSNQVFLGKTLPEIIKEVMGQRRILNYKLELQHQYSKMEYVCQYNESYFDFLSRWMEDRGLYYFFTQGESQETLVITDSSASAASCSADPLVYSLTPSLTESIRHRAVTSWVVSRSMAPSSVRLKSYNYVTPELDINGENNLPALGSPGAGTQLGEIYDYGEYFDSLSEAKALAAVRAEELGCRKKVFSGKSFYNGLRSGWTFTLQDHYQEACNIRYLVTEIEHHGHQTGALPAEIRRAAASLDERPDYQASLTAIPATIQFRPKRIRSKPSIRGMINATVEVSPGSRYAMLDDLGRYKVRLPFDLSDSPAAKASCWLRKAEPYAGEGHGMHFPLQGGTEVLISFLNGDIDRPFIAAAVHNGQAVSQVTEKNPAVNVIRTTGNNHIAFGDKKGKEYISLHSPFHDSSIAIGSTVRGGGGSISFKTKGGYESFTLGDSASATVGASTAFTGGIKNILTVGASNSITVGASTGATAAQYDISMYKGYKVSLGSGAYSLKGTSKLAGLEETIVSGGYEQTVGNLISKANKALILGMAAAALATAGAEMESDTFDGGFLSDDGGPFYKNKYFYGGVGLGAAGLAACVLAQKSIKSMVKAFDAASASSATSMLKLNKSGATLAVDSLIGGAESELKLVQGKLPLGNTMSSAVNSTFTMSGEGDNVDLVNCFTAKLSMSEGTSCTMSISDDAAKQELSLTGGVLTQSSVKVKQEVPRGGSVTLEPTGVTAAMTGGCSMSLEAERGVVSDSAGKNGLIVTPAKTTLQAGDAAIDVTPASIKFFSGEVMSVDASGMVKIM
jgi:type VI secretion system secreted protein VgrG